MILPLTMFTGCSFNGRDKIEAHLQQKYGQIDYSVITFKPNSFSQSYDELSAYLPGGDQTYDGFDAKLFTTNGQDSYQDSYYGFFIRDQFEAMIKQVADKYFKDCKVYTTYEDFPDDVTPTMTLDQVLAQGKMAHNTVSLFLDASDFYKQGKYDSADFDKALNEFTKAWEQICNRSALNSYVLSQTTYDNLLNRDDISKIPDSSSAVLDGKYKVLNDWSLNPVPGVQ